MCRVRLWHVWILAVDPFFTCKSHPLYSKPFNFFSTQDTRNRNPNHPVFPGSPNHENAVLSVEPARKVAHSKALFPAHVQELANESALGATMAVVVHKIRLVRLLIPCCQSCTCNKRLWGSSSSFFTRESTFYLETKHTGVCTSSRRPSRRTPCTSSSESEL